MALTRRETCIMIPAIMAVAGSVVAKSRNPVEALPSKIREFGSIHGIRSADHAIYPILAGETRTGFKIELHETALAPGAETHPPHRHIEEELFLIQQGTPEIMIDGNASKLSPGSVAYVAPNSLHEIRNTGNDWARYFVMRLNVRSSRIRALRGTPAGDSKAATGK